MEFISAQWLRQRAWQQEGFQRDGETLTGAGAGAILGAGAGAGTALGLGAGAGAGTGACGIVKVLEEFKGEI